MKTGKQLFRQPMKTLAGILTVALAVAILCISAGQFMLVAQAGVAIEEQFSTVALMGGDSRYASRIETMYIPGVGDVAVNISSNELRADVTEFVNTMATEHPDLLKTIANPGLASAWIPELTVDNVSHHMANSPYLGIRETTPTHACAILEITVTEISDPHTAIAEGKLVDGTAVSVERAMTVNIVGTVENVISLEEGYDDPTGRTARITLNLWDTESMKAADILECLKLEVGERYLVYSDHYQDGEWILKSKIAVDLNSQFNQNVDWQEIDTDGIRPKDYLSSAEYPFYYPYKHYSIFLSETQMQWKDAVIMTVQDLSMDGNFTRIYHDNGSYPIIDYTRYITDENGNQVQITAEEWYARYSIPTITRLDESAEEFLASEEGAFWRKFLEYSEINHHAFPVIGVEKLGYIAAFAKENARVIVGRDFTAEELETGAKVCILSETLAVVNGLTVGDTICPRFYNYDWDDPNQEYLSQGKGVTNPWAYKYSANTAFSDQAEEYTIVGIYRLSNAWGNLKENSCSFTPNTIFVPQNAVTSDMDYSELEFFQTIVLQNGAVAEFRLMAEEAGMDELFTYYDQGYTTVKSALANHNRIALQAVIIGLVAYSIILLLFLLLFPGSQGNTLGTMTALGATRGQKICQILGSSAGILVPGTLVGLAAGMLLWDRVVVWLAASAESVLTLEMDQAVLAGVAGAQLILALAVTALLSLPLSRHRGIRRRK